MIKFAECELDDYESEYSQVYRAIVEAHKTKRAVKIALEGKHHGSVLNSLRRLHKDKATRVASRRDPDNDALIVYLDKNWDGQS